MRRIILGIMAVLLLSAGICPAYASENKESVVGTTTDGEDMLAVHFISVGTGDAILIRKGETNILIDTPRFTQNKVVDYLNDQGITYLDLYIITHLHVDHAGGVSKIVRSFDVGRIYTSNPEGFSKSIRSLLSKKKLKPEYAARNDVIYDDDELKITVLSDSKMWIKNREGDKYDRENRYSTVLKVQYHDVSFILMGDATTEADREIVSYYGEGLKTDVLKIAHHGHPGATSDELMDAAKPSYSVITCGEEADSLGKNSDEVRAKCRKYGELLCTSEKENGTVVISSDGKNIFVKADHLK